MSTIIETLRKSDSLLLKAEGADISKWSKLRHTKSDLELFLQFNIAEIKFKTKDGSDCTILCTSNTPLIKIIQEKKLEEKKKIINIDNNGITTKDKKSVLSWDINERKLKTISLKSWYIVNFISITPKNILILDTLLNNALK